MSYGRCGDDGALFYDVCGVSNGFCDLQIWRAEVTQRNDEGRRSGSVCVGQNLLACQLLHLRRQKGTQLQQQL